MPDDDPSDVGVGGLWVLDRDLDTARRRIARQTEVAARIDQGPRQAGHGDGGGAVDGPSLRDAAEIERHSVGEPEAAAIQPNVAGSPGWRPGAELGSRTGHDVVEVPVVPGGDHHAQERGIEAARGSVPSGEGESDKLGEPDGDTVVHDPAVAFTRESSLSPRNREKRRSSRWNVARTRSTAGSTAGGQGVRCTARACPLRGRQRGPSAGITSLPSMSRPGWSSPNSSPRRRCLPRCTESALEQKAERRRPAG